MPGTCAAVEVAGAGGVDVLFDRPAAFEAGAAARRRRIQGCPGGGIDGAARRGEAAGGLEGVDGVLHGASKTALIGSVAPAWPLALSFSWASPTSAPVAPRLRVGRTGAGTPRRPRLEGRPRCRADDAVGRQAAGALELADAPGRGRAEATIGRDGTAGGERLAELVLHLLDRRPMAALAKGRVGGSRVRRGVRRIARRRRRRRSCHPRAGTRAARPRHCRRCAGRAPGGRRRGAPAADRGWRGARRAAPRCTSPGSPGRRGRRSRADVGRLPGRLDRDATLHGPSVRRGAGHPIGSAGPESVPDRAWCAWGRGCPGRTFRIAPATALRVADVGRRAWRPPMPLRLPA